jgi:hypothetical protein
MFTVAEFLDVIGAKVLRVFLLAILNIHSQLYQQIYSPYPPSKSGVKLVCIVNIVCGNLTSENSQDFALKTSTKLYVHEFGFRLRPGGISQPEQSGEELLPNLSLRNQEHMETVKAKRIQEDKFKSRLFTSHF